MRSEPLNKKGNQYQKSKQPHKINYTKLFIPETLSVYVVSNRKPRGHRLFTYRNQYQKSKQPYKINYTKLFKPETLAVYVISNQKPRGH